MGMTDLGRRTGGVAAVVAAFWLGFVCGGGGSLPGAAAVGEPSGQPRQEPAEPRPGEQAPVPGESSPAQPPEGPAPAPDDPPPPDAVPVESGQADPAAEQSGQADPAPEESAQTDPEADETAQADPGAEESAQTDPGPEETAQADPGAEEPTEPDAETEAAPGPEPPVVQDRPREFTARTGMVLNFVRQDAESTYEETMARVAAAFAASESEERQQQAEGWSTYKAEEPLADGVRLYVSWLDPAVPGADYWVPAILNEAFPTEAQTLYETYAGAFADGQILLNLVPVAGP